MFRFHLVKKRQLQMDVNPFYHDRNIYLREVKLPVVIDSTGTSGSDDSSDGDESCAMLKDLLEDAEMGGQGFNNVGTKKAKLELAVDGGQQKQQLDWNLKVSIGMVAHADIRDCRDFIRVTGPAQGNILTKLKSVLDTHGVELRIIVEIKNFTCKSTRSSVGSVVTKEVTIDELASDLDGEEGAQLHFSGNFDKSYWSFLSSTFTGIITITAVVLSSNSSLVDLLGGTNSKRRINWKGFEENDNCDAIIIACDGEVKCHKAFLTVRSPVLQAMFKDNFKESTTNTVEMSDMTCEAVKAFLDYLYHETVDRATVDSGIALDLFKAGHKYDVPGLEKRMKYKLLSKPDNWFQVDVAVMLYLFARNLDDGDRLKRRAAKLIKLNADLLKTSASYNNLFKKDPKGAMELFEYVCSKC